MTPAQIERFFATLQRPTRRRKLSWSTPASLSWVAVLLSAQATDVGVNKATRRLFVVANTPQKILALGQDGLEACIKTIGLYRSKARHLMETCRLLLDRHDGQVPRSREALEALARRGPQDGQRRAQRRLWRAHHGGGYAHLPRQQPHRPGAGATPWPWSRACWPACLEAYRVDAHHWLILHGRYVCQARKPRCAQCLVAAECDTGASLKSPA